ncbi:FHA domain-containing protein [Hassallia byssoidea VB512170]|uniref:FHA domain-containing protein n=1 Tax=Hassallia byssoidea VB512170 TaxID=1304833 RepID=A0A846H862_9CYAN|nr:FHA domain-containing protein [Hassalia byssoidea]NEU73273.1 FHA domain-containing protein [Hassalia byssoidea VB512170]
MQYLGILNTTLSLELFHLQTNTSLELPAISVIRIGKPNEQVSVDIDVSLLPNADVVSRLHAEIHIEGNSYYIEDLGSTNGTYINNTKLISKTRYQLNLGDKIDLGQESKVTFIFQQKEHKANIFSPANPTAIQREAENGKSTQVDRPSKFVGLALMVAGIIIFAANTQVGLFVRIPGVLLCIAGVVVLMQQRIKRNYGWILIALGIAVIVFTGNVFASVNFLAILIASALLFAGYKLFSSGKVFNYSLRSLDGLLNNKK